MVVTVAGGVGWLGWLRRRATVGLGGSGSGGSAGPSANAHVRVRLGPLPAPHVRLSEVMIRCTAVRHSRLLWLLRRCRRPSRRRHRWRREAWTQHARVAITHDNNKHPQLGEFVCNCGSHHSSATAPAAVSAAHLLLSIAEEAVGVCSGRPPRPRVASIESRAGCALSSSCRSMDCAEYDVLGRIVGDAAEVF